VRQIAQVVFLHRFSKDENADSLCKTACGTPECVAPEILSGELYNGKSSDIWSLGVLFFAMLTGIASTSILFLSWSDYLLCSISFTAAGRPPPLPPLYPCQEFNVF